MCNFAVAGIISVTYIRKRIFALFHYVNLDTSLMNIGNKMEECSSWSVFVSTHEIHPSGVSLPYPCSRESKPYVEDEVR